MTSIEELVTMEELQEKGWLTSNEVLERGVPAWTLYRWTDRLREKGLAVKIDTPGQGMWLVAPSALSFLQSREGQIGRPKSG